MLSVPFYLCGWWWFLWEQSALGLDPTPAPAGAGHEGVWEGPRHQQRWVRDNVPQNRRGDTGDLRHWHTGDIRSLRQEIKAEHAKCTGPVPAAPAAPPKSSGLDWALAGEGPKRWAVTEMLWVCLTALPSTLLTACSSTRISNFHNG